MQIALFEILRFAQNDAVCAIMALSVLLSLPVIGVYAVFAQVVFV